MTGLHLESSAIPSQLIYSKKYDHKLNEGYKILSVSNKILHSLDEEKEKMDFLFKKKKKIITKRIIKTPCNHQYHIGCFKKWINFKLICPKCRKRLTPLE